MADRLAGKRVVFGVAAVEQRQDLVDLGSAEQPLDTKVAGEPRRFRQVSGVVETTSM